jgi:hypothetical protein
MTPEWVLFSFLEEWTADDLEAAIRSGVQVDLSAASGYVEDLVVRKVLEWFYEYRPDLYRVLASDMGVAWLRLQIRSILKG